LNPKHSFMLNL